MAEALALIDFGDLIGTQTLADIQRMGHRHHVCCIGCTHLLDQVDVRFQLGDLLAEPFVFRAQLERVALQLEDELARCDVIRVLDRRQELLADVDDVHTVDSTIAGTLAYAPTPT